MKLATKHQALAEELKGLLIEGEFSAQWTLLVTYHTAGSKILEEGAEDSVQILAEYMGRSPRTLYYAVAFAKKFPSLDRLKEGKNITWKDVIKKYLTDGGESERATVARDITCPNCQFVIKL